MMNLNQTQVVLKDVSDLIETIHTRIHDYATQRTFTDRTVSVSHSALGSLRKCLFELEATREELECDLINLENK